jgi:hypothetical protein
MTIPLAVADITSYLLNAGWERDPRGWHGASVWQHPGDYEVLVPAGDGLGDGDRRVRDILRCLSAVEDRPVEDIASEIARPHLDKQFFRTYPAGHDAGYTSLLSGLLTVQGIRSVLSTMVRTVVQGPHFAFDGRAPGAVGEILRAAELGPTRPSSYVVELRLAADAAAQAPGGNVVGGRSVLVHLLEAVSAAQAAVMSGEPAEFDETVTAGVSADLCHALSELSGAERNNPFEITFRWARSRPLDQPVHVVAFPDAAGPLLREAAGRLRSLNASGTATVSGVIEVLHDDAAGNDRWRIRVRGELRTEHTVRTRRAVWIRLADQTAYDRAMAVHRERRVIVVTGELSSATGRVELVPSRGFEI